MWQSNKCLVRNTWILYIEASLPKYASVCGRREEIIGAPIVIFGTKWLVYMYFLVELVYNVQYELLWCLPVHNVYEKSISNAKLLRPRLRGIRHARSSFFLPRWSQSAPFLTMRLASAAKLAKSEESIEGAILADGIVVVVCWKRYKRAIFFSRCCRYYKFQTRMNLIDELPVIFRGCPCLILSANRTLYRSNKFPDSELFLLHISSRGITWMWKENDGKSLSLPAKKQHLDAWFSDCYRWQYPKSRVCDICDCATSERVFIWYRSRKHVQMAFAMISLSDLVAERGSQPLLLRISGIVTKRMLRDLQEMMLEDL